MKFHLMRVPRPFAPFVATRSLMNNHVPAIRFLKEVSLLSPEPNARPFAQQLGLARVSCDTRWLKASETPDPRYVWEQGKRPKPSTSKFGVHADATEAGVTIEQKKLDWGFE
eukprot:m.975985 g.975985  ORF g.975985 m.975985 type:complete len:112 (-) comp23943_c0_seq12:3499-3834(-)